MSQLTEKQTEFVTRIKENVNTGKFVTDAFIKIGEDDSSTFNTFKLWLFDFCVANSIYFLENRHFILVGLTPELCKELDKELTTKAADSIGKLLHSLKMLDTVQNAN